MNTENPYIVTEFLDYLETIKGKSINTTQAYEYDLRLFFKYMKIRFNREDRNKELNEIDIYDIDIEFIKKIRLPDLYAFMSFVAKTRDNGFYARARKVACIKSFYKYIVNKAKYLSENPALELESPKVHSRQPIYLQLDEAKDLLNSIDGTHKERDLAIITLFLNCGLRLSELTNIKVTDINIDTLRVIGKGDKERTVYLNDACIKAIDDYITIRNDKNTVDSEYLFLSQRKKQISKRTVQYIVKKYIEKSNISNKKVSAHKLRHTAATLMYKYGNTDIRALQSILGHQNISTTQIYTHIDDDQLREAVNNNPLSNFNSKSKGK